MESAPQAPAAPTEPAHNQLRPLRESSQLWKLLGHGQLLVPIAASWSLAGGTGWGSSIPWTGSALPCWSRRKDSTLCSGRGGGTDLLFHEH